MGTGESKPALLLRRKTVLGSDHGVFNDFLQKIHVIEPYISSVGFVHNKDGSRSMLRNLTIEEYRAEQLRRAG